MGDERTCHIPGSSLIAMTLIEGQYLLRNNEIGVHIIFYLVY
jgi:hypothetical protein